MNVVINTKYIKAYIFW